MKRPDFQQLLDINKRLDEEGLNVCMFIGWRDTSHEAYSYMKHLSSSRENFYIEVDDPIEDIIKVAKELDIPTFTAVTDLCTSLIDETVYIDQQQNQPIKVKSIPDKNGILDYNDNYYLLNILYYME